MKTIFALIFGLTLFLTTVMADAQVIVTRRESKIYYPVAIQNSQWRTFFVAPHGFYYDNRGHLTPVGFRFHTTFRRGDHVYGRVVRLRVVATPVVTFGAWTYTPEWR
jgi:hypothetical protein